MLAESEINARARADYEKHLGTTVTVRAICGFVGSDIIDIALDPPAEVVVRPTEAKLIERWCDDEWCDPQWRVEAANPHPQLVGLEAMWIYATGYAIDGSVSDSDIVIQEIHPPSLGG